MTQRWQKNYKNNGDKQPKKKEIWDELEKETQDMKMTGEKIWEKIESILEGLRLFNTIPDSFRHLKTIVDKLVTTWGNSRGNWDNLRQL